MRLIFFKTSLFSLALTFSSLAFGSGMSTVGSSVESMAKGGTGTANVKAADSAYANPANILFLKGLNLNIGAVMAFPGISADLDGEEINPQNSAKLPPHLHISWSNGSFGGGYSFNVPFGSGVHWPSDWLKRFDLQKAEVAVLRHSLYGGLKIKNLAFAGGIFFDSGQLNLIKALDFIEEEGNVEIKTSGSGMGLFAGATLKASEDLFLGFSYRSRSSIEFEGNAKFERPIELSGKTKDGKVKVPMTFPDRLALGGQWSGIKDFNFSFDLELTLWSSYDQLVIDFYDQANTDQKKTKNWENTLAFRFGLAWAGFEQLELRAGAFYDPSPVPDESAGPDSPDSDRIGLSLGAGLELADEFTLQMAYQYLKFTGREVSDELGRNLKLKGAVHLIGTSLSMHF